MLDDKNICPICGTFTHVEELSSIDSYNINCPRCGKYKTSDEAITFFQRNTENDKVLSASYWIRSHQSEENIITIDESLMRKIIYPFIPPKPKEQADNFILWLGNKVTRYSEDITENLNILTSIIGAIHWKDVRYIIRYLTEEGLVHSVKDSGSEFFGSLTFSGWQRFEEIQRTNKDSRLAFMAMKFGDAILDHIFNDIIKDAVDKTGFEVRKLDDVKRAGLIDDKLRVEIRRSKFLIADLTHNNNGAYWEAGYAEGLGMPVIYICEKEKFKAEKPHFDTNHHLTLTWKDDEESLQKFAEELKDTIRATFPAEAKMEDD